MFNPWPAGPVVAVDPPPDDDFSVVAVAPFTVVAVFAPELALAPATDATVGLAPPDAGADVDVAPGTPAAVVSDVLSAAVVVVVDSPAPTVSDFLLLPPQPAATSPRRAIGTHTRR